MAEPDLCPFCWAAHDESTACSTVPLPPMNELASEVFVAQYCGGCYECRGHIAVGDRVGYNSEDFLVHERCPA